MGNRAARYRKYREAVSRATVATLDRVKGLPWAYGEHEGRPSVDHIIPVSQGFKRNVDPEWMGSQSNLRMVPLNYNIWRAARWDEDAQNKYEEYAKQQQT